jgi:hypothetical protein
MTSIIKVDQIQNSSGTTGLTIDSNGVVSTPNTVMYDIYTLGSNFSTDNGTLTDWGKPSAPLYVNNGIGDLMSISSGIFTFPKTGVYKVSYFATISNASGDNQTSVSLYGTEDNSTYSRVTYLGVGNTSSNTDLSIVSGEALLNISDTANRKVFLKFESVQNGSVIGGSASQAQTSISFQWLSPAQT